jgi:hypothetical protein
MTRLLCLRLHARPSGATLDHCTWRDGSPLQGGQGSSGGGSSVRCDKRRQAGSKGCALGGSRAEPWPCFPSRVARTGNGHEVYRAARIGGAPVIRFRRPAGRRSRIQRWNDTVAALTELQAEYTVWLEALPDNQQDSAIAEALRAIAEFDLGELQAIEPPRGFGRD